MLVLTEAERGIYETRLKQARQARHDIVTGNGVKRFVDQNGETVEYQAANLQKLEDYIAELEGILNPALRVGRARRPLGFIF
jgi:hypothetical protein